MVLCIYSSLVCEKHQNRANVLFITVFSHQANIGQWEVLSEVESMNGNENE